MANKIWRVFIPHRILSNPEKCWLVGNVCTENKLVCVTGTSVDLSVITSKSKMSHIGRWSWNSSTYKNDVGKPCWISLSLSDSGTPCCSVVVRGLVESSTCILYNPANLLESHILRDRHLSETNRNLPSVSSTNLHFVISNLLLCKKQKTTVQLMQSDLPKKSLCCGLPSFLTRILSKIFNIMLVFHIILNNRWTQLKYMKTIVETPAVMWQLKGRSLQIYKVQCLQKCSPVRRLESGDVYCRQLVDSLLGIAVMLLFMQTEITEQLASFTIAWGENVADQLTSLLNWLMGAPAGLKLNSQLTHLLGQFFLYHVYLWTGYLSVLQPALGTLLWYSSMFGILGVSVQLCFIQDILSTLTLHIYCFYVYAARLYRLQIYSLSFLWRLFRGKKWNVVLRRVDSAIYNVDQLFVGTLMFTILLFLLPTTALYYVVFTMLRLCVLIVQGLISHFVSFLNGLPVYSFFLWFIKSPKVTGDATFSVFPPDEAEGSMNLVLMMQTTHIPLQRLVSDIRSVPDHVSTWKTYSWGSIFNKLLHGHLVYPWISSDLPAKEEKMQT